MKYSAGNKFRIDNASMNIEIEGCFPGGQGRTLRVMENSYQITINGVPMDITERHLELLEQSVQKEVEKPVEKAHEPTVEEVSKIEDEIKENVPCETIEPKRRGRPARVK